MLIEIEIPDDVIPPKRQDSIDINMSFIDGKVCGCDYPFATIVEEEKTKADVLDKIRAEIVELQKDYCEYGWAYDDVLEIIDKYKAEQGANE